MKRRLLLGLLVTFLGALVSAADGKRPTIYPFDVTVGGQKAVVKGGNLLFAELEKPVAPDAVVSIEKESTLFVINAFPCKKDGSQLENKPAAVIFKNKAKAVKLSETLDKKVLKPGTYLMNIVAHGGTSRVVFTVAEGSGGAPTSSKSEKSTE